MAWSTVGQHAVNFQQAQTAKSTAVRGLSWFMFFYFVYFIDTYAVLDASKTPRGLRFTRKHLVRNWSGGSELLINTWYLVLIVRGTAVLCVVCWLCVCYLTLNRFFYLTTSSTTSVRADSSFLPEIQVMHMPVTKLRDSGGTTACCALVMQRAE